jgi:pimeloyl-ACP methyl ester carboxylesterase
MATRSGYAEVNGARIYYDVTGSGSPVVFVHGFSLDTRMWDDQVEPFAAEYEVICYDVRGFGRSGSGTSDPFSSVDDLKALLDYLGYPAAHVVGLSMGGGIATSFAAVHPEATLSLVPVDSNLWGYRVSSAWNESVSGLGPTAAESGVEAARQVWLAHALFAPANEQPPVAARLRMMVSDFSGWHWLQRNGERGLDPPTIERLPRISAPTLVVVGERDLPDFLEIGEQLASRIPNARKVVLPGVGHMSNMEAPTAFNAVVLEFLRELA